ncbi:MAG: helix-turn-helix domain-containing protein [Pseudomonadota bacterium]
MDTDVPGELASYVRRIVYVDCEEPIDADLPVPPTGYNYIQWVLRATGEAAGSLTPAIVDGSAFGVAGQISDVEARFQFTGRMRHIVAELTAAGMYSLLGLYGEQIRNSTVFFDKQHPCYDDRVENFLSEEWEEKPIDDLLAAFKKYLIDLAQSPNDVPAYVSLGAERSEANCGDISIKVMAGDISERHFSRQFSKYTGATPKFFNNVIRVNAVLPKLLNAEQGELAEIAIEAGFFDQSHLIKTIRAVFDVTPKDLRDQISFLIKKFHVDGHPPSE